MAKQSLKNLLGKKTDVAIMLSTVMEQLNAEVFIEDEAGKILVGNKIETPENEQIIYFDYEIIGSVKGDDKTGVISNLLTLLYKKEAEKKKLGSEVLNLYQEVNLMFNFSDRLAQAMGAPEISKITLNEASGVIKSDNAVIVLWEEHSKRLKVMASAGELFFDEETINRELSLLFKLILSGQSEIITDINFLKDAGIISAQVQSIVYSALKVNQRIMGAVILAGNNPEQYSANDLKLLTTLALQSSAAIESALLYEKSILEAREREESMRRIHDVTKKFVPNEFIKSLGHEVITDVKLGDHVEKIVTVLFSDIREYTTLSERMTPKENFNFVCSFNERMGPIIQNHNGFINQYLGDAIMAIFPENAQDALMAAIDMQKELQHFNEIRESSNKSPIKIGIGMHTGPLIMGITGDDDRMDATTISDTVNTASRLESLTKYYKAGIILSDITVNQITPSEKFYTRSLGPVQLKGKQAAVNIFECINSYTDEEAQKKLATLDLFHTGLQYYLTKSFDEALSAFETVCRKDAADQTARIFLSATKKCIENGVPENWAGVGAMMNK
ncbi:MAG: GAF domain-containing protein [Sphingobacteriales bacterium]|nr:GAF domain-containing protein [Sphingobacteriales bacterium]